MLPNCSGCYTGGATNGTDYMRKTRTAYKSKFGADMPADGYNIHLYGPPNDQDYTCLFNAINTSHGHGQRMGCKKSLYFTEIGVRKP